MKQLWLFAGMFTLNMVLGQAETRDEMFLAAVVCCVGAIIIMNIEKK
tara:strand:- start:584 stop:724 length:141 start_codon:yes stop_codon:yes gene_type:complete